MLFLSEGEKEAVRAVVAHGHIFGYGNLVDRLKIAWAAEILRARPDFPLRAAMHAATFSRVHDKERIAQLEAGGREAFLQWADLYTGAVAAKDSGDMRFGGTRLCPECMVIHGDAPCPKAKGVGRG